MENQNVYAALGVAFNLSVDENSWRFLSQELSEQEIRPIDRYKMHTTLIHPDSIEHPLTSTNRHEYENAHVKVREYLNSLRITGQVLTSEEDRVRVFNFNRRKVGAFLLEQDYLNDVREDIKDIIKEEAGIKVCDEEKPLTRHVTLGNKSKDYRTFHKSKARNTFSLPAAPKLFTITGFSIIDRTLEVQSESESDQAGMEDFLETPAIILKPRFRNKPAHVRRAG